MVFDITVDISGLLGVAAQVNGDIMLIHRAVGEAAEYVRNIWQDAVQGNVLPGMTKPVFSDSYFESLSNPSALRMIGPMHAQIVCTYEGVDRIEHGYASFDQKPGLTSGPRSRLTRDGQRRYNTIPFRHGTPTGTGAPRAHLPTMPEDIYAIVRREGVYRDPGAAVLGQQRGQRTKLPAIVNLQAVLRGLPGPMKAPYTWKAGQYEGMRRVGAPRHRQYMTWRRVSWPQTMNRAGKLIGSDPNSWIHPGQAPNPVMDAVVRATEEHVRELIWQAALTAFGVAESDIGSA